MTDNKSMEKWKEEKRTVTLTNEQYNLLTMYLHMSKQYREKELKCWEEFAQEKDSNGNTKFPNAVSNAEFWEKLNKEIEYISKIIDGI